MDIIDKMNPMGTVLFPFHLNAQTGEKKRPNEYEMTKEEK